MNYSVVIFRTTKKGHEEILNQFVVNSENNGSEILKYMREKYTGFGVRIIEVETLSIKTGESNHESQKPIIPEKCIWDYAYYTNLNSYVLSDSLISVETELLKKIQEFQKLIEQDVREKYSKMDFVKEVIMYRSNQNFKPEFKLKLKNKIVGEFDIN